METLEKAANYARLHLVLIALKYKLLRFYRPVLKKEKYLPPNSRYLVTYEPLDIKSLSLRGKKESTSETRKSS